MSAVNPSHYKGDGMEAIDVIDAFFSHEERVGFLHGNIIKYVLRYRRKGWIEDLKKAKWYLERLIETEKDVGHLACLLPEDKKKMLVDDRTNKLIRVLYEGFGCVSDECEYRDYCDEHASCWVEDTIEMMGLGDGEAKDKAEQEEED